MPKLLMVPLDGSAHAEQALPLALAVARRSQAALQLVTVSATLPFDSAGVAEDEYLARIAGQIESELPGRIKHRVLTNELRPLDFPPPLPDSVADVLARHAAEQNFDLIIMTTHGRGGLRRAWLGSVTDSLMRIAPRPVLAIKPVDEHFGAAAAADRGITHVVVPLDGSETAERVIAHAQQLGEPFAARFTLVRVVSPLTWQYTIDAYGAPPDMHPPSPLNRQAIQDYLDGVAAQLRARGPQVAAHVLDGTSPAPAILEFAETHAADLIVLSTSGAGGVTRLLLGSVADKIVRSAEVPVMVCNERFLDASATPSAGASTASTPLAG